MRLLVSVAFGLLVLVAAPARGRAVSVSIGINLPGPPPLVAIPASPVTYAPAVPGNYFFYGGQYWLFAHGLWYVSAGYNGPWTVVAPAYVPPPVLAVPVRYYRVPPPAWRRWRRDAPPHWAMARPREHREWAGRPRARAEHRERH